MKVQVQWHNEEHNLLYYQFEKDWDWEDMHKAFTEARSLMASVPHRVDIIMDLGVAGLVPKGALAKIRWAFDVPKAENIGVTIIVTPNAFVKYMTDMASKMWGSVIKNWPVIFVTKMDDAMKQLAEYREAHNGS
jgi:hypothetical protein